MRMRMRMRMMYHESTGSGDICICEHHVAAIEEEEEGMLYPVNMRNDLLQLSFFLLIYFHNYDFFM